MELISQDKVYVDVILPVPIEKPYTYVVPEQFSDKVGFGLRVEVQFGRSKRYAAIITEVRTEPPPYKTKPIIDVIDDTALIDKTQLRFWLWLSQYYSCSVGEVMNAALPASFKLSSETVIYRLDDGPEPDSELSDKAFLLLEAMASRQEITLDQVRDLLNIKSVLPLVHDLYRRGYIAVFEQLKERYKPKLVKYVELTDFYNEDPNNLTYALDLAKRSEKQTRAMLAIIQGMRGGDAIRAKTIYQKADVDLAVLKALQKKEIIKISEHKVNRIPIGSALDGTSPSLSESQQKAYEDILAAWEDKEVALLHGVTGSGKTWIYKKIIYDTLQLGGQVLFLLPEIALTVQVVERLRRSFGEQVVVAHSGLTNNERADLWKRVQEGAPIVLGVRSSLFLPFQNLQTVIIDEEHDQSYKQSDPAPRYQGRDAGIYLATLHSAKVLLGTATPSVESYFNATRGKYGLIELRKRYQARNTPVIHLVDLRKDRVAKDSQLSRQLIEQIEESLKKKEQIILFKNRRGYAPVIRCNVCSWQAMCERCDVSLTYHKYREFMHCHMCGFQQRMPLSCPQCASTDLRLEGFGTQKIEDEIAALFPDATVKRMDYDSTRGRRGHELLITQFERREVDILVGTQMVTKGLDFDHVGLVGVLHADQQLYYPHYRSVERTFQLLVQVSGRAGRKDASSNVVIQSYNPTHPVFADVAFNDYESFYDREIVQRQHWHYPPYFHMITLTLKHKTRDTVREASALLAARLRSQLGGRVIGPAEPSVARVRNQYLMDIGIKVERGGTTATRVKQFMREQVAEIKKHKGMTTVRINVDVDPA